MIFRSSASNSLARTMMLRRPMFWIRVRASRSAPAPMESMDSTAATPKMIPSMVSTVRSLCRSRFSTATLSASPISISDSPLVRTFPN